MRKSFLLLLSLSLSACATTGPGSIPPVVQQAQQIAQVACGFLPTAETILNILSLAVPGVGTAEQIASAICGAVGSAPVPGKLKQLAKKNPTFRGVPIKGHFVHRD